MNLLLVNAISAGLSLVSIAIVVVALRKAAETIRLGRALADGIAASSAGLEKALAALQAERDDLRDESRKLSARLEESAKAQREINRSLDLMERIRAELQGDVRALRSSIAARPVATSSVPQPSTVPAAPAKPAQAQPSKLPVFVHRRVQSAAPTIGAVRS
ncbi:BAB2_0123 family type IV secretion system effector [Brucella sp. IR073]|uniref:BAB2_0123 family type IV secretion system effector n=1 Tax=unclassified Brucella TaxID=2632610 RepID=UPI003B9846FE